MRTWWWKWLGLLMVVLSVVLGLRVPLAPGVVQVSPDRAEAGAGVFYLRGYNTEFTQRQPPSVWFQSGDEVLCPQSIAIDDAQLLSVELDIPTTLPDQFLDAYVYTPQTGVLHYPSAIYLSGVAVAPGTQLAEAGCLPQNPVLSAAGFDFPNQPILSETIRNLFYHVPVWFAMLFIMLVSVVYSVRFLASGRLEFDAAAREAAVTGVWLGFLGLATGSVWARFTWGAWWVSDPRLNGAAMGMLVYLAYFVLRANMRNPEKAGRVAAAYNILAYVLLVVFLMVLPRMQSSLHPGVGGNPAFSQYDLDNNMRLVFYPAVLGWILLSLWIWTLRARLARLQLALFND